MVVFANNNQKHRRPEMKHIGMDLGGTTTTVTVLNARGKRILDRTIPTREDAIVDFLGKVPGDKRVVVEESQLADWVVRAIKPHVSEVIRCQPQHNALISRSENKCDEEDCHALARLSYLGELKPVHHTDWGYRQLREGVREFWKSSWDLTRAKNRLKAHFLFNGVSTAGEAIYLSRWREAFYDRLRQRSANLELTALHYQRLDVCRSLKAGQTGLLRKLAQPYEEEIRCLKTIPGIGPIGAYTMVAYLENGWRFSNKRQLWKYCRLSIRRHESQGKGHRGASYQGNRYLKCTLMTGVASLITRPQDTNGLTRLWHQGLARGVEPQRMRRNLARKLVVVAHHVLRYRRRYQDELIPVAG
jgi:transposase